MSLIFISPHFINFLPTDMVRRFEVEVQAVATLDHPNIIQVYEVGQHNGIPFFSMKLAEHGSLVDKAAIYSVQPRVTAGFIAKLAGALFHAHKRGVTLPENTT